MSRRLLLFACVLTLLSALPVASVAQAQPAAPRLVTEFTIDGATKLKFPSVAVRDGIVHVAATSNEATALYWNKQEGATSFGAPFAVGSASGQGDYSSASLFAGSDGNLYYAWGSIDERRLKLRVRTAAGAWGPERTVFQGSGFPVFTRTAFSQGRIFVVWEDNRPGGGRALFARTSTDGGATFSGSIQLSGSKVFSIPSSIGVGPNGEVAVAYTLEDLEVHVAIWNGSGFTDERVTQFGFANPSASYTSDGKLLVGYRGIDRSGGLSGAWVAERQAPSSWSPQQIATGYVEGAVNVVVDKDNTRHFAWQSLVSGSPRIFYAYQPAGQARSAAASSAGGTLFNPTLAVGNTSTGLAHVVSERFEGDNSRLRYFLFEGKAASPPPGVQPKIENAPANTVPIIGKKDTVSVSFENIENNPTQIRWRWGGAPSDSASDSGGWQNFTNPISVAVRQDLPVNCSEVELFVQARNTDVVGATRSAKVRIDGDISAAVAGGNPYSKGKAADFSGALLDDFVSSGGASDGDPAYTRVPVFYLELQNQADCSGLKDVATGQSATSIAPPYDLENGKFANIVPLPQLPESDGAASVVVRVSDMAGNIKDYTQQFTYDTTPPTLSSTGGGVLSVGTGSVSSTLLVNLDFEGVQVSDNLYPAPGFWGVWVANSRTAVADPLNSPNLLWVPVQTPGAAANFTVQNWSLAAGLTKDQVTAGDYFVYVRFLDGAGNPSSAFVSTQTTLPAATEPAIYLPSLSR